MRLDAVVEISRAVAGTAGRLEKVAHLADLLGRVPPEEIPIVIAFLSGEPRQGRMKIGGAVLSGVRDVTPAAAPRLELREVDALFDRIAAVAGAGSSAARAQLLRELMGAATAAEQDFLFRLLFGELRQGALEGVLIDAVARASGIPAARIRRAAMLAGDLAPVARAALAEGEAGLAPFALRPFQPVQPMLADSADDTAGALDALGEASFEYKLDGARIQVHKVDDEVRVYSRNLAGRDARRARDRRDRARHAGAHAGPRRRGDRAASGRLAGPVPGHDAALRAEARRRSAEGDAADHADVLRRAVSRRRAAGRRAADASGVAVGGAGRAPPTWCRAC